MKTIQHQLEENVELLIQDLKILKVFSQDDYDRVVNEMKKDLGYQFFNDYFKGRL